MVCGGLGDWGVLFGSHFVIAGVKSLRVSPKSTASYHSLNKFLCYLFHNKPPQHSFQHGGNSGGSCLVLPF